MMIVLKVARRIVQAVTMQLFRQLKRRANDDIYLDLYDDNRSSHWGGDNDGNYSHS